MAYDKTKTPFVLDEPELDGTDWANPGWWRGNDDATRIVTDMVDSWLDDEEGIFTRSGSFAYPPLTKLRDKVRTLMDGYQSLIGRIVEQDAEHTITVLDLSRKLSNLHVENQNIKTIRSSLAERNEEQRTEIRELRDLLERYVAFALATIGDAEILNINDVHIACGGQIGDLKVTKEDLDD